MSDNAEVNVAITKRLNFKITHEKLNEELETLADLLKQQKFFQEKNIQKQSDLVEIA